MANWQTILGHQSIKKDLQILLTEDKLPHALLFSGKKGIGKYLTARVLAKALLCNHVVPCDNCTSCHLFDEQNHPDYYDLKPDGKTLKMIKIEQIRQMQAGISLAPYLSNKRVVVIDDAELMNEAAANSLLKTLEEPVGQVFFILVTSNKDMLLSTILSRCMKIYFSPLADDEVLQVLQQQQNIPSDKAKVIAKLSGGSVSTALEFVDTDTLNLRNLAIEFLTMNFTAEQIWSLSDKLGSLDKPKALLWANYLLMLIRDLLLVKANADKALLYNSDISDDLYQLAQNVSTENLFAKINLSEQLAQRLNSNADLKLMIQNFILDWRKLI